MKKSIVSVAVATSLISGLTAASWADGDEGEERYAESAYRHNIMEQVKYSALSILSIVKGEMKAPNGALAHNADVLMKAAASAKDAFEKDTRGIKGFTEAKDNIWEDWEDFSERMDKFAADTQAFADAAKSGDNAKIGAGIGAVFKNCKSCHDKYKSE